MRLWPPFAFWGPRCSTPPVKMSAVVFPAAIAHFTSTQVIFSNSTWSVFGHDVACPDSVTCADPSASVGEAAPKAIDISKNRETEPTRMSFSNWPVSDPQAAVEFCLFASKAVNYANSLFSLL